MKDQQPGPDTGRGEFPGTRWSLVLAAKSGSGEARRRLNELFTIYWSPIHAFLRRKGCSREDAQDLTQDFLHDLLRRNSLVGLDPLKGRFRSFILASLEHFFLNHQARQRRLKRGGGHRLYSLFADSAERRYLAEPSHHLTAERLFEREWASTVLHRAGERLRAVCESKGFGSVFEEVWPSISGEDRRLPAGELARRLGKKEGAVRVLIHRLRLRYRELLLEEVGHTVATPEGLEEELTYLHDAVAEEPGKGPLSPR